VSRFPLPSRRSRATRCSAAGGMRRDSRGSWGHTRLTCRSSSSEYSERFRGQPGPLCCCRSSETRGAFGHRSRQARTRVLRRIPNGMHRSHRGFPAASSTNNSMPGSGLPTPRSADGGGIESRGLTVSVGCLVVLMKKATWRAAIRTLTSVLRILTAPHQCERTREINNSDNSD
jgi:hypothetical protein